MKEQERTQERINEQKAEGFLDTLPVHITKQGHGFLGVDHFLPSGAHFLSLVLGTQVPCGWGPIPWQGPTPTQDLKSPILGQGQASPKKLHTGAAQLLLPEGLESGLAQC